MIGISSTRDNKMVKSLEKMHRKYLLNAMDMYGQAGVELLRAATPVDTGITANSWHYRIIEERNGPRIEWYNTNPDGNGVTPVVVLIQYGHSTKSGTYVEGRDFINPAIQPLFDQAVDAVWVEVTSA